MENIHDKYINLINDGDEFLRGIDFEEYLEMNMLLLKNKGFDVTKDEESINKAFAESEEIWNSKKFNKISFMPGNLKVNSNLNNNIKNHIIKDSKSNKWESFNINQDSETIEVKVLKSNIDIENIINSYDKLKIKEGYTLQIYKAKYEDMEIGKIFAFKNREIVPSVSSNNIVTNDFEIIDIVFDEAEENYLKAIEIDKSPEAYLQLVLLNNKLNEICNEDNKYEIIEKRTVIEADGAVVEGPNFYYDKKGNATIEYFKKYTTYNEAYKRVINTFNEDDCRFKIVEQFVAMYM